MRSASLKARSNTKTSDTSALLNSLPPPTPQPPNANVPSGPACDGTEASSAPSPYKLVLVGELVAA